MSVGLIIVSVIAILVLGDIAAKIVVSRSAPELKEGSSNDGAGRRDDMRDGLDELVQRVDHLEEERDFYKKLLEAPRATPPPDVEQDASDAAGSS